MPDYQLISVVLLIGVAAPLLLRWPLNTLAMQDRKEKEVHVKHVIIYCFLALMVIATLGSIMDKLMVTLFILSVLLAGMIMRYVNAADIAVIMATIPSAPIAGIYAYLKLAGTKRNKPVLQIYNAWYMKAYLPSVLGSMMLAFVLAVM